MCKILRAKGVREYEISNLKGSFKSLFGKIDNYGANKSIGLRNLTDSERAYADELSSWGYPLFVSSYPFKLMIRV